MFVAADALRSSGIALDLHNLGDLHRPANLLRAMRDLRARARNYDIVHAQFGSACGFVTAAVGKRAVLSLRGSDWHQYVGPMAAEARHAKRAKLLTRLSLARYAAIITMSLRMTREVRAARPGSLIQTIPDPVDLALFSCRDRSEARARLFGVHHDRPWVLFTTLSRSNPIKRLDLALEAVGRARDRIPGLELKVASGIAHADMPDFVSACNLVLCTSTHEGWPNCVKEGLACGLPFVSTDVSDLHDIAARHSSCQVTSADPDALADAIVSTLAMPLDRTLRDEVLPMDSAGFAGKLSALYERVLCAERPEPECAC